MFHETQSNNHPARVRVHPHDGNPHGMLPHWGLAVLVDHGKTWLAVRGDWTHHGRDDVLQLLGLAVQRIPRGPARGLAVIDYETNGKLWEDDDRF